jgi:chitodextrinase
MLKDIISAMAKIAQQQAMTVPNDQAAEVQALFPEWAADRGYTAGFRVQYNGTLYKCLTAHTSQSDWTPEASPSLWAKVLIPDPTVIPAWEQPDSTNPYSEGDKVTHSGKTWESLVDNNVWEPGAQGTEAQWKEVPTEA